MNRLDNARIVIGLLVALVVWDLARVSYEEAVRSFGVVPTSYESDMAGIRLAVLERIPVGSSVGAVADSLRSWGFEEAAPTLRVSRGRRFLAFDDLGGASVRAFHDHSASPWAWWGVACDQAGITLNFRLEEGKRSVT